MSITTELVAGALLVITLLTLGSIIGWRQIQTRRGLRNQPELSDLERSYLYRRSQRRLVCSVLMIVLAFFFIGWFFLAQELAALSPDEVRDHPLVKTAVYYWIGFLLVFFVWLALAAIDLAATLRHGFRSARLLESQGRAELAEELAKYRRSRAEMN